MFNKRHKHITELGDQVVLFLFQPVDRLSLEPGQCDLASVVPVEKDQH